jgi:methionyl-tRNA synthetase
LAKSVDPALDAVLAELIATCGELAEHLTPFLPSAAERVRAQCRDVRPSPVFPRLEVRT